jgi:chemotaxis protein histidine kinase CheA
VPTLSPELLKLVKASKNKHTRTGRQVSIGEGKTIVRLIANPDGSQFWFDLGVHWIKTEINGKPVAVVGCHDEVYGQPCPVCTAIAKATEAATSDDEIKLIKEWKATKTVIVNALVRSGANKSDDPQIVELKPSVWGQIMGMIAEYAEADKDLLDLNVGQDFVIERRGRGIDTKYTVMLAPRSEKVNPGVLDQLHDLKAWVESNFFRGEETKAMTAIAQVTGVNVNGLARIAGPSSRSNLLTKPTAVVEDAEVAEVAEALVEAESEKVTEVEEVVEETVAEAVETDEERELREFREFKAAQAAKAAAGADKAKAEAAAKAAAEKKEAAAFAAKKAADAKAAAAKKAATESTVSKKDDAFNADLPKDEIDSLLADLDS